jgi:hypothetical protein
MGRHASVALSKDLKSYAFPEFGSFHGFDESSAELATVAEGDGNVPEPDVPSDGAEQA